MNTCPVCGGDRNQDMTAMKARVRDAGLRSESINPGGRVLEFADGRSIQLGDQCNACDAAKIDAFLGAR